MFNNSKSTTKLSKVSAMLFALVAVACGVDGGEDKVGANQVQLGTKAENAKRSQGREEAKPGDPSKAEITEGLKKVTPKPITNADWPGMTSVIGGQNVTVPVGDIPAGHIVGTFGAGPCIGVIVYDCHTVYVFHFFSGEDDIKGTLNKVLGSVVEGASVLIFGGDGTGTSNPALAEAVKAIKGNPKMKNPEIADSEGLFVQKGADGQLEAVVRAGIDKPSQK